MIAGIIFDTQRFSDEYTTSDVRGFVEDASLQLIMSTRKLSAKVLYVPRFVLAAVIVCS